MKMNTDRIKLIIFDFDGTLGDTRQYIVATMQAVIEELQLPARSEAECASTIGLPLASCFETLFPTIPKDTIGQCAERYRKIFSENLKWMKPQSFPMVRETLTALKDQGYILAIASSRSHSSLEELSNRMGIADSLSYLIGADDVKNAKPNPEPVLNILAAFGMEASQTLVVGDMAVDILMGIRAGAKTCGVTWGNGTKEELEKAGANAVISSMSELMELEL